MTKQPIGRRVSLHEGVLPYLARLSIVAFVLQWLWEVLQMPAYAGFTEQPWEKALAGCTMAAVADVGATALAYGIVALKNRDQRWGLHASPVDYVMTALVGGLMAVGVEAFAVRAGTWSYASTMPVFPGTELGLLPLLQFVVLIPLAIVVTRHWSARAGGTRT